MSTGAFIRFKAKGGHSELDDTVCLVTHYDGYPEGIANLINNALIHTYEEKGLNDEISLVNAMICALPGWLRISSDHDNPSGHYGAEYCYDINLDTKEIEATRHTFRSDLDAILKHSEFKGSLIDFTNHYLSAFNDRYEDHDVEPIKPLKAVRIEGPHNSVQEFLVNEPLAHVLRDYHKEKALSLKKVNPEDYETHQNYQTWLKTENCMNEVINEYLEMDVDEPFEPGQR